MSPKAAQAEANAAFKKNPISASLSGLWPRLIGVLLKRVPKFGFLLGYSHFVGEGTPGFAAATCASICSAPFINPWPSSASPAFSAARASASPRPSSR